MSDSLFLSTISQVSDSNYTAHVAPFVIAVCSNTLQHTATHCNTLQHTATHCNTVKCLAATALCCLHWHAALHHTQPHCNTLPHTTIHYNTQQHLPATALFCVRWRAAATLRATDAWLVQIFSKVSSLPDLLYKLAIEMNFEKFLRCDYFCDRLMRAL